MGQDTQQLRREIAETRQDLTGTLDAIGDRVSPSRMMERRKNRISGAISGVRDRVMGVSQHAVHSVADGVGGTAGHAVEGIKEAPHMAAVRTQGSPMVAGAVAFGIGFVVAAAVPPSNRERELADGLADRIEPLKEGVTESAKEMVEHLKEPAQEAMANVKQTASEGAHAVQEAATDAAQQVKENASPEHPPAPGSV